MAERMAWGVLGAADIALQKVIPGMLSARDVTVAAIAARDESRARAAAEKFGIASAYGSYDALLADPAIEAVYIPLPNHLHVDWSIRALDAGKHVLCEKPIGLTADDARRLVAAEARSGRQVIEAFMIRHHPQWRRAREIVRGGTIGDVSLVRVTFAYLNRDPDNIRNQADIGGGGLYDIGCYCVVSGRYLFEAEPERVVALIDRDPVMGTDRLASGILDFGGGRQLVFSCGTQLSNAQRVEAFGDGGRLEILIPFNAPPDRPTRLVVDRTGSLDGSGVEVEEFAVCDQYGLQADAVTRTFRGEMAEFGLDDAIRNMAVIDALFRSGASGRWETV